MSTRSKQKSPVDIHRTWHAIRERVCVRCLDGDGFGNCRLDASLDCPLREYFPKIIPLIQQIKSESIDEYARELRQIICAECQYQSVSGTCNLRDEVECALDRYFPLVIESIEAVESLSRRSKSLNL